MGLPGPITPAWLSGAVPNQWVQISGTSGAGGAEVDPWGAFAVDPAGRLFVAASGGHNDSPDNRVVVIDLMDDSPNWSILEQPSASFQTDVSHYSPDGHPTSRHNYVNATYVPALDRVFLVGAQAIYAGTAPSKPSVDAYHVSGLAWDLAGTFTDVPGGDNTYWAGAVFDGTHIWLDNLRKFNPFTNTHDVGASANRISTSYLIRPWSFDSSRNQLFGLAFGDGRAIGGGDYRCSRVPIGGNTEIAVTLTSNSARTDFVAEAGGDAGMDYDPINDRHLWYTGQTRRASDGGSPQPDRSGKVYAATRVSDNEYALSVLTMTGTAPSATIGAGVNGRFKYIPSLRGFVLLPSKASNLWFFKVA